MGLELHHSPFVANWSLLTTPSIDGCKIGDPQGIGEGRGFYWVKGRFIEPPNERCYANELHANERRFTHS